MIVMCLTTTNLPLKILNLKKKNAMKNAHVFCISMSFKSSKFQMTTL